MLDKITESLTNGRICETFDIEVKDVKESVTLKEGKTNTASDNKSLPSRVQVTVEAIHAGMTKNKTFYPAGNLLASVESWTKPYPKPVLTHHNTGGEAVGRVVDAQFKNSVLKQDSQTIQLTLDISDPETIQKVLDKRYMTMLSLIHI